MYIQNMPEPTFFVFSGVEFIPKLLYYSHIPPMVLSLLMGIFVFLKNRRSLLGVTFLGINLSFVAWIIIDLIAWTNPYSEVQMFVWTFFGLFSYSTVFFGIYFFSVYISEERTSIVPIIILTSVYIAAIFFAVTEYGASALETTIPGAYEKEYYSITGYLITILLPFFIVYLARKKSKYLSPIKKRQNYGIAAGLVVFLVLFNGLSALGSYLVYTGHTIYFNVESYGPFGILIFLAVVAYYIVRQKLFDIEWQETKVLVYSILILTASQLFFIGDPDDRILAGVTLIFTVFLGYMIIQVIKREQRIKFEELQRVNMELQKLDTAKTEFINIASHQLRTPLTIVKGVASLLVSRKIDKFAEEDKQRFYDSVWSKCLKLEHIIDDILNAATFTSQKFSVMNCQAEPVDLKAMLEKLINDFKYEIEKNALKINFQCRIGKPIVYCQREYLEEAFVNLLSNAIKYTSLTQIHRYANKRGHKAGLIVITVAPDAKMADNVAISFQDDGIGIPAEEIPKLFQRFYRAENARKAYTDGTGLGLFIVKEIIEGHGGTVRVESKLGKGSTFIVSLPVRNLVEPDIRRHILARNNKV